MCNETPLSRPPLTHTRALLLLQYYSHPCPHPPTHEHTAHAHAQPDWWFIGGRSKPGDTTVEAAIRNVRRELGLDFLPDRFRPVAAYSFCWSMRQQEPKENGTADISVIHALELQPDEVQRVKLDEREYEDARWWSAREILRGDFHPALKQAVLDWNVAVRLDVLRSATADAAAVSNGGNTSSSNSGGSTTPPTAAATTTTTNNSDDNHDSNTRLAGGDIQAVACAARTFVAALDAGRGPPGGVRVAFDSAAGTHAARYTVQPAWSLHDVEAAEVAVYARDDPADDRHGTGAGCKDFPQRAPLPATSIMSPAARNVAVVTCLVAGAAGFAAGVVVGRLARGVSNKL